jgi:EpsI family protein
MAPFVGTVASFHPVWTSEPNTHGYLVAFGVAWLTWRERDAFAMPRIWPASLGAVAILTLVWLLARTANIQSVMQAILPLVALAWCAAGFGPRAAGRLLPIVAVFFAAVPVWGGLQPILRWITVLVSYGALWLLQVPATIDGTMISLVYGSFSIEDACSGLNYFVAGSAIGGLYAVGLARRTRIRLQVLGLAIVLSVVANWIRVTSLIVIGHVSRMEASVIYDHGAYGWAVFVLCVIFMLFPGATLIMRRGEKRALLVEPDAAVSVPRAADAAVESPRVSADPSPWHPLRTVLVATSLAAAGPILFWSLRALPAKEDIQSIEALAAVERFRPTMSAVRGYEWRPAFAGAERESETAWTDGSHLVVVDHYVYSHQAQGTELVGEASRIAPDSLIVTRRMIGPMGVERRIVNEAIVKDGGAHVLTWYWYRVGGVETASALKAKLLEIPAFFRRIESAELIALSAACAPGTCAEASESLVAFLNGAE